MDRDIDIYDVNELLYALSIRVDPAKDIMTVDGARSFNLESVATLIPGMEQGLLRSG